MAYPYFVDSVPIKAGIGGGLVALMVLLIRMGL
jgi:hypothetical protein